MTAVLGLPDARGGVPTDSGVPREWDMLYCSPRVGGSSMLNRVLAFGFVVLSATSARADQQAIAVMPLQSETVDASANLAEPPPSPSAEEPARAEPSVPPEPNEVDELPLDNRSTTEWDEVTTAAPAGRIDADLAYVFGLGDNYHSYDGVHLQATFAVIDTLAVGVGVGFLNGSLTDIVTDDAGIIGNKMARCLGDPAACADINPNVPGWPQITGILEAVVVWSPVRLDFLDPIGGSAELYAVLGPGVHGTRSISAEASSTPRTPADYTLSGDGFGEGGFLDNRRFHLTTGGGLRLSMLGGLLSARAEVRALFWWDRFDFGDGEDRYGSSNLLVRLGLGVAL